MKGPILTVLLLLAAGPVAAEPGPDQTALAQRYLADTGGSYELIEQQIYVTAGVMGDTPDSHARQHALQQAADKHRAELDALDTQLAALIAATYSEDELRAAVGFLESPAGRAIAQKKHAYYTAMFARDRPPLAYSDDENTAIATYAATPQALSMQAKSADILKQTLALAEPVQTAIRKNAQTIYCRTTHKCTDDSGYDQNAGPSIRE